MYLWSEHNCSRPPYISNTCSLHQQYSLTFKCAFWMYDTGPALKHKAQTRFPWYQVVCRCVYSCDTQMKTFQLYPTDTPEDDVIHFLFWSIFKKLLKYISIRLHIQSKSFLLYPCITVMQCCSLPRPWHVVNVTYCISKGSWCMCTAVC